MTDHLARLYTIVELIVVIFGFLTITGLIGVVLGHILGLVGAFCRFISEWD